MDAAMAKMWLSNTHCKIVDECLQLFGGWGYMWEYPITRADARHPHCEVQRIGCVGDSDRMLRPNEFTELPFEGFDFGAAGQEIGAKCANDSSDIVFVNGLAAVGEHGGVNA
jgi:hypothetical protein